MASKRTPDGLHGADAPCAIRNKTTLPARAVLRPEEKALLQEWQAACDDPVRRRDLGRIIRRFV